MRKLTIDFLRPFTPAQVSNMMALAMEMETYGVTPHDVVAICQEYMDDLVKTGVAEKTPPFRSTVPLPPCPECGGALVVSPVNVSKCTNIGGLWNTSVMCENPDCRYTELSVKKLAEWGN